MTLIEVLLVTAAFGVLVLYHLLLLRGIRRASGRTAIGHARRSRRLWVASVMAERRDILAVQTLRNWSMASSFLASTAVLLTIGLLSFLLRFDEVPMVLHELNFLGSTDKPIFTAKVLLLVVCFLTAFFNFSLSLRYFNHVALDVTVPSAVAGEGAADIATSLFDRGADHYTLGMRSYYIALPVTLWFFGPIWLLAAALTLVAVLYRLDHLPAPE